MLFISILFRHNKSYRDEERPGTIVRGGFGTFSIIRGGIWNVNFDQEHTAFIQQYLNRRNGERRGRLERGHKYAEALFLRNVWWPLRGNFTNLHPEYEVQDWRGRSYFADFAWLPGYVKLLFEIKGYATHVRDMDRHKYSNEVNRETFLHGMGYHVISFAYDDVEQQPDLCISLLRMILSQYLPDQAPVSRAQLA